MYQTPKTKHPDRRDHVFAYRLQSRDFICCLCGAVARTPPDYPTPADWEAGRYEPLTLDLRACCPPAARDRHPMA